MVAVRRRVIKKKRAGGPSLAALIVAVFLIVAILVFQGFRLLFRMVSSSSSSSDKPAASGITSDQQGHSRIENALHNSRQSLRGKTHENHTPHTQAMHLEAESQHQNKPNIHVHEENDEGLKYDKDDHKQSVQSAKQETENIHSLHNGNSREDTKTVTDGAETSQEKGQEKSKGADTEQVAEIDAEGEEVIHGHTPKEHQGLVKKKATEVQAVDGHEVAQDESKSSANEKVVDKQDSPPPPPPDDNLLGETKEPKDNSTQPALNNEAQLVLEKHGSGPTKLGYVVDLDHSRKNPAFRTFESALDYEEETNYHSHLESVILRHLEGKVYQVHACEKALPIEDKKIIDHRLVLDERCHDEDTRIVAFNGADFSRHVCGFELTPGSSMLLEDDCRLLKSPSTDDDTPPPVHLLPHDVIPINPSPGMMPPVQVVSTRPTSAEETAKLEFTDETCDIPCQWEKGLEGADRFVVGTNWEITWTDRDPALDKRANMERTDYRHDHYYATTSWKSSIPLSSFSFEKFDFRQSKPIDFDAAENAATSVIDNHCTNTPVRRQKWLAAAQANLKETHFYGSCQHNTDVPKGSSIKTREGRIELIKKDRVVLAYEESTEKYHVTDIVWEALVSGAVPAILGASNLESEILPPNAAIFASNYNSWDKFAQYIQKVSDSKSEWESFQTWRSDDTALVALEEKLNFTRTSPECRMCRWAYSKRYGLGWNHSQQVVQETSIPRKFCLSSHSHHVIQPFVESFHGGTAPPEPPIQDNKDADETDPACQEKGSRLSVDSFGIHRTVWNHDGFTDMTFHPSDSTGASNTNEASPVILRLQIRVQNGEGAIFHDVHSLVPGTTRAKYISSAAIQDEFAKVTILANWPTTGIRSPAMGLLEIDLPRSSSQGMWDELKLRIIVEDASVLHDKLTEYHPSSYGKMAMKDFIDPIEMFYVSS
eukprot:CAMPEP_0168717586 /NCGR_PEP_ID=MMETSP0724-20121128/76_1 /TAXON_ID=265536 /ORGANISM="Amphiprora sp., Strain CCMP467" /LENGTH=937 /DNA_ID=CAMNT_0008764067 /DNA_START=12 /DNA_END=2825 /DNA_ORIENTATION=+